VNPVADAGFRFPDRLYPIVSLAPVASPARATRKRSPDPTLLELAEAVLAAGPRLIQLRAKGLPTGELVDLARRIKALCDHHGAALIINDRADVARLVDAAGVHLGQTDLAPQAARRILGPAKVIGYSTHSLAQLEAAVAAGAADYLAFGPIFPTGSKDDPDPVQGLPALREVRRACPLALVAIGGITRATLAEVLAAGADAAAVIGAIAAAADPARATRELLEEARGAPQA
jgi:thiamine-phosphate pyrophosphorylase